MDSSQSVIVNFLSALEMFQKCVSYQGIVKSCQISLNYWLSRCMDNNMSFINRSKAYG